MADSNYFVGIDFGTSKCTVAWFNRQTGRAEIIRNSEGEDKTPSVVYYGETETLVGTPAVNMLETPEERRKVVQSVKREMAKPLRIPVGGKRLRPVEIAADIFRKLKRDTEEGHFHSPVTRAVVTVPASFDTLERERIAEAARLAGFEQVELLEEPASAALAYSRSGFNVGRYVMVYDLGAGTFDLAIVSRPARNEPFRLSMEPQGIRCGGDDFDLALYDYCDTLAQQQLGRSISDEGGLDLHFLRECRKRKENLSSSSKCEFSSWLPDPEKGRVQLKYSLDRAKFEELIGPWVEPTIRLTKEFLDQATSQKQPADTVVLIGGSSRVPLIQQMLKETLPIEPHKSHFQDIAVALGAAYYAAQLWGEPETDADRYRREVEAAARDGKWEEEDLVRLSVMAGEFGLTDEQAEQVEMGVLGCGRKHKHHRERYRREVQEMARQGPFGEAELARLDTLAAASGLQDIETAAIETEFIGRSRQQQRDLGLRQEQERQERERREQENKRNQGQTREPEGQSGGQPPHGDAIRSISATVDLWSNLKTRAEPDPQAREFYRRAEEYLRVGQHDEALQHAQAATELAPQWPDGFHLKAEILRQKGMLQLAAPAVTACLRADDSYAPAYLLRGRIRIQMKEPDGALQDLNQYVVRTGRPGGQAHRAVALFWMGKYREALDDLKTALQNPQDCMALDSCPAALYAAAGHIAHQMLNAPGDAVGYYAHALSAVPVEASEAFRAWFAEGCERFGLGVREPVLTLELWLWAACKALYGGCNRDAVAAFAGNLPFPVEAEICQSEPDFGFHMASFHAERGAGDHALGWLQYLLQSQPEFDARLVNGDRWIAACQHEGLLQWRTPSVRFDRGTGWGGNYVKICNMSPYRLHTVRVNVTYSRIVNNARYPTQKELALDSLGPGQMHTWPNVFEGANTLGSNIQDLQLVLVCDEGWVRQG